MPEKNTNYADESFHHIFVDLILFYFHLIFFRLQHCFDNFNLASLLSNERNLVSNNSMHILQLA